MKYITHYFGTDTEQAGHYVWGINPDTGEFRYERKISADLPFHPESLTQRLKNGSVNWIHSKSAFGDVTVCAIAGSPADDRGGCKSVFWIYEHIPFKEMKERILNTPGCRKIIDAMKFKIFW